MTFVNKAKKLLFHESKESSPKSTSLKPQTKREKTNPMTDHPITNQDKDIAIKIEDSSPDNKISTLENELKALKNTLKKYIDETSVLKRSQYAQNTPSESLDAKKSQNKLYEKISTYELAFAQSYPDYQKAIDFIKQRRLKDLTIWGCDNQQKMAHIIHTEILAFAQMAIDKNKNPAACIYQMAQEWGYQPLSLKEAQSKLQEQNIAKANMPKSLGDVSGQSPIQPNFESLANMNDQDFQKYWQQMINTTS